MVLVCGLGVFRVRLTFGIGSVGVWMSGSLWGVNGVESIVAVVAI